MFLRKMTTKGVFYHNTPFCLIIGMVVAMCFAKGLNSTMSDKKEETIDTVVNAGLAGAATDVVSRYGSGIKEHMVAYGGVDNETGQHLKRSLKGISQSKVNPEYKEQNLKQQAGFSAETKEVARERAEQAISGKKPTVTRTDDIAGHVNDELFDITTEVDASGNPVPGSSAQMKFVGSSPKAALDKMMSGKYQKYFDNDCKMMVPSDYFDGMKEELAKKIESLEEQVKKLKELGNEEAAAKVQKQLDKCKQLDKNLVKSSVSNDEAMEARTNPALSTAKDIVRVAHRAGVEQAKMGAAIGGGISIVRNAVALFQGKKDTKDAVLDVAKDTAGAAALSYATGFTGSAIKGVAQNSTSSYVRTLSKTNLPAYIATTTIEAGKTLTKYFKGEIDGAECLNELGEKGYGMVNSAMYAAIGQVLIPIPVVGALAGSMIGYALSSASYKILSESLKEAKLAHEDRIRIERECEESIRMLRAYRKELEEKIEQYLHEKKKVFDAAFDGIKQSLQIGDVDGYIAATNEITKAMGEKPLFETVSEFSTLMESEDPIVF